MFDEFRTKIALLMWKNWLVQKRHLFQTSLEILSPLIFAIILVIVRSLVDPEAHDDPTYFRTFPINYVFKKSLVEIAWSPDNTDLRTIMEDAAARLNLTDQKVFNNSYQLFDYLMEPNRMDRCLCGIVFADNLYGNVSLPADMEVTIRFPAQSRIQHASVQNELIVPNWRTNLLYPLYQTSGPRNIDDNDGGYSAGYNSEGFLAVQDAVFRSIIEFKNPQFQPLPEIRLQRFPYPSYLDDVLQPVLKTFISMVIMLSFAFSCVNLVKAITHEKESQLKELMKIMGLSSTHLWLTWFLKYFLYALVTCFLIVALLKVNWYSNTEFSVLTRTDFSVLFVFLVLYMCSTVTFCFLLSALFSSANSAAMFAGFAWFLSYAPFLFTERNYDRLSLRAKLFCSLGLNSAMGYGFRLIVNSESNDRGSDWSNVWEPLTPDDSLVLGHIFVMLAINTIVYFLLAVYVEKIFPGKYGIANPWYFPVSIGYWFPNWRRTSVPVPSPEAEDVSTAPIEPETSNDQSIGIQIVNVSKTYDSRKTFAIDKLSLNLKRNQITVLLGHNGAGKTTVLSMLTGMLTPTSGNVIFDNRFDIFRNVGAIRSHLGICLQNNVLFDDLTVREHLEFFIRLKMFGKSDVDEEIRQYLIKLDLLEKSNYVAKNLSGGMKRRLCIAIALCGGSKYILLDEPTAGIDPSARHSLWTVLEREKKNRTILLSTHYMDEADVLGDKIAILAKGQLKCSGSTYFLKKAYQTGYQLNLEIAESVKQHDQIDQFLRSFIETASLKSSIGSELIYSLPSSSTMEKFQNLFNALEENYSSLGILNFGLSFSSLNDVFEKVVSLTKPPPKIEIGVQQVPPSSSSSNVPTMVSENSIFINDQLFAVQNKRTGLKLYKLQLNAMFLKHFKSTIRLWYLVLIQWLIVSFNLMIAIYSITNMYGNKDLPPLQITLDSYNMSFNLMQSIRNASTEKFVPDFVQQFGQSGKNQYLKNVSDIGIEDYLLEMSKENLPLVRLKYLMGVSFVNDIIAWFNNIPYHTAPLSLLTIYNSLVKVAVNTSHSFQLVNHPLPFDIETKFEKLRQGNTVGFQIAFNVGFHMAFVTSFYILFAIRQKMSGFKHLQKISGLKMFIYWFCAFVSDFAIFLTTLCVAIATMAAFNVDGFSTIQDFQYLIVIYVLFAYAILPLCYLFSFWFKNPSTGYSTITLINIITGSICFIIVQLLQTPNLKLENLSKALDSLFLMFPHYSLTNAILNTNLIHSKLSICEFFCHDFNQCWQFLCTKYSKCCDQNPSYFSWKRPGIGQNVTMLLATGTGSFLLLTLIEIQFFDRMYRLFANCWNRNRYRGLRESEACDDCDDCDEDVKNELVKVENMSPDDIRNHSIVLKNLTKYYGDLKAVDRLHLSVSKFECFGLLGKNGAGKTSTFQMLTGEQTISEGTAWVSSVDVVTHRKQAQQLIGYCPQFDAFLGELTGKEILQIFLQIKGFVFSSQDLVLKEIAAKFDFREHFDKKVQFFSGGNKRKLSVAIAFLGDPAVVFLDEPTCGMDPVTKRIIWRLINNEREHGKCIILTSHSMEECEVLCSRITIMVNGKFRCLGSSQHLKSKFSQGVFLKIKLAEKYKSHDSSSPADSESTKEIEEFIADNFENAILNERFEDVLIYYVYDRDLKYSKLFSKMEEAKQRFAFEDYFISQTTLEQVFLMFTKLQRPDLNS